MKLQIYKASAGSGKTFLLTENYLKLAFEYPDNFSKILAVTFTNKAAEEMKTRIIEELNNIIKIKNASNHFNEIKKQLNYKNDDAVVKRAILIRNNILHNYSMFHVSTIDSFVQKVIRAFAYEMNLSSGYDIELDTQKVIDDLTEKLYKNISDNKYLQNWLLKYAEYKINDGKNWDFRSDIKELSNEIFKEKFQNVFKQKKDINEEREKILNFLNTLYSIKNSFEGKMNELLLNIKNILNEQGGSHESLGSKFKTIVNQFLIKIPKKEYDNITQAFHKSLNGIENWYKKNEEESIINSIEKIYEKILVQIKQYFEIFNTESENYYSAMSLINTFHSYGILNDIASLLPEYRDENNILLISDTTLLLKKIIGDNEAPFIYEKIGNKFKNILIDEFQDTSTFQWSNFKPLILNSLSQANYNLIVGDIKQSIYRWRGGDWKLLLSGAKHDIGSAFTEDMSLDTNYRSKKNIVDFNNTLFQFLPRILQNQYNAEIEQIKNKETFQNLIDEAYNSIIINAYEKNCQKVPNGQNGGIVNIKFKDSKKSKNNDTEDNEFEVAELINKLLQTNKPKDIGIIVSKNSEAKTIVNQLLEYQSKNDEAIKYQIISSESLYISNSSIIKLLVSAMKFINNKKDNVNIAQLVFQYQKIIENNEIDFNDIFLSVRNEKYTNLLPKLFLEEIEELSKKSVFELSEELIRIFRLKNQKEDFSYLRAFQNEVSDFMASNNSNLAEFIRWWEEKGITKSIQIPSDVDAIQIMTIHKSKGLAFNILIMPFVNWKLENTGKNARLLWTSSNVAPFNKFEILPVKYSSKLLNTVFRKDYFDEKLYSNIDALNMLYVAFTRAKNELYAFASYSSANKGDIKDVGQLMYEIMKINTAENNAECGDLLNLKPYFNINENTFLLDKQNDEALINIKEEKNENKSQMLEIEEGSEYPNNKWFGKVQIRYNSEDFFIESIEAIEEKVNYGTLMHKIFAEIKTEKDISSSLQKMYFDGFITKDEMQELEIKITEVVNKENVKDWFSDKYEVKNEEALITLEGDIKIPDRVLIGKEDVIVIDFKFGKQQEKYKEQIQEYKQLIQEVYKKTTKAYLFYVEENAIVEV